MTSCSQSQRPAHSGKVRSVPFAEWSEADRVASITARRPAERLKAGTDLMTKAEAAFHQSALARARQFRNGLMVAMLGYHPIRPKNFAALELGLTFKREFGSWWIVLPSSETKEKRTDERIVDARLIPWIDRYLEVHRPVLARRHEASKTLWLSSNDGCPLTPWGVEQVISRTTLATTGIKVSPHLFRTAAVSTAAVYAGSNPHLGSALLHHRDPTVRERHYNRACSLSATQSYGALVRGLRKGWANRERAESSRAPDYAPRGQEVESLRARQ